MTVYVCHVPDAATPDDEQPRWIHEVPEPSRNTLYDCLTKTASIPQALIDALTDNNLSIGAFANSPETDDWAATPRPGDTVCITNDGTTITAIQQVDWAFPNPTEDGAVGDCLRTVWNDIDTEHGWLSTTTKTGLDISVETLLNHVTELAETPRFEGQTLPVGVHALWDPAGPTARTDAEFLQALNCGFELPAVPVADNYFVVRCDPPQRAGEQPPVTFHSGSQHAKQLLEACENSWILLSTGSEFIGVGFFAAVEPDVTDEDQEYRAVLEQYRPLEPVSVDTVTQRLSADFPNKYGITEIARADIDLVVTESHQTATSEVYESVGTASADIRNRLVDNEISEWRFQQPADALIASWTAAITDLDRDGTVDWKAAGIVEQVGEMYEEFHDRLLELASKIEMQRLEELTEPETLFVVYFRELQRRAGERQNFTASVFQSIVDGDYTVDHGDSSPESPADRPRPSYITTPSQPARASEIATQLEATKQVVFYGPPGTSKTYMAQQFGAWWAATQENVYATTDQIRTVTFHPSLSYEDFVEGLTAKAQSDGSGVTYPIEKGIFREICEDARDAYADAASPETAPRYVLIIDEMNRGNLAQIFGELITLLEADKRLDGANETLVELAHSGEPLGIPPNLYLIGTMNTADRSIALVDTAIRRRFRFLSFQPDYDLLRKELGFQSREDVIEAVAPDSGLDTALRAISLLALESLNAQLRASQAVEDGKQVGHTYLLGAESASEITAVWRYEILPLLEDLYYGQLDRLREDVFAGGGDRLFDWDTNQIRSFDENALTQELLAVANREGPEPLLERFENRG